MGLFTAFNVAVGATTGGLVDRLCRENGWAIDERGGQKTAILYFNGDHVTARRSVYVVHADGDDFMSFVCPSRAKYSARAMPDQLLAALLVRNREAPLGAWHASADDENGSLNFRFSYFVPVAGMSPAFFKRICCTMAAEVAHIETGLSAKGLL